jgi:hypothetical protein
MGQSAEGQVTAAHIAADVEREEPRLREPESFVTDSKHACPLLQRETLSLSAWDV